jgi:hypothetical protein
MRVTISTRLIEKAEAALVCAIEAYNKPLYAYREETFALLALNAWELLLKTKILADNANRLTVIYEHERRATRKGGLSKKLYLKRNRSGNPQTISLGRAVVLLDQSGATRLSSAVKANLDALIEIRDNAAHFVNAGAILSKQILEIGSATIRNFCTLVKKWFSRDLSRSLSFLMPLGFIPGDAEIEGLPVGLANKRLIAFLTQLAQDTQVPENSEFHIALRVNLSFHRSRLDGAAPVIVTVDPSATKVILSEEDFRQRYPWDYGELTDRLARRYSDFKINTEYHSIRKPLLKDASLVNSRYLDPGNPRSAKKDFYSPNVIQVFDRHYTRRDTDDG